MGIARIKQKDTVNAYYTEFVIDKVSDIADLPHMPECAPGSVAICIEDSEVYMLNTKGQWKILGEDEQEGGKWI